MKKFLLGLLVLLAALVPVQAGRITMMGTGAGSVPTVTGGFRDFYTSTANSSSYTFNNADIGPPAAGRVVIVTAASDDGSNNSTISSITVDGVSGSVAVNSSQSGGSGFIGIAYASVNTGNATGTITVNFSNAKQRAIIGVWAIYTSTATPSDTKASGWATTTTRAVTPVIAPGGFAVVAANNRDSTSIVWVGATERFDTTVEGTMTSSGADLTIGVLVTATALSADDMGVVSASWDP